MKGFMAHRVGFTLIVMGFVFVMLSVGIQYLASGMQLIGFDFTLPFLPILLWTGIIMTIIGALYIGVRVSSVVK